MINIKILNIFLNMKISSITAFEWFFFEAHLITDIFQNYIRPPLKIVQLRLWLFFNWKWKVDCSVCGYGKERRERKETQPGVSKPWQPVRKYHISKICFSRILNKSIFQLIDQVDSLGNNITTLGFSIKVTIILFKFLHEMIGIVVPLSFWS